MKKWIVATAVALTMASAASVSASMEIGLGFNKPVGDMGDAAGGGLGLDVRILRPMNDNLLLTGHAGLISFGGSKATLLGIRAEAQYYGIPVTVGGRFYLQGVDTGGLFIKGNAGLLYKMVTTELRYLGQKDDESENEAGFYVSPGIGFDFGRVNVTADYNLGNEDWTWFALKAAYRF
jgi:hypothetical protein